MLESPPSPLALVRIRFPGPALGPLGRTPEPTRNQARSQAGTSLAPAGFHGAGARVVPAWLRVGSGFVPGRFRVGSGFLPGGQRARVFCKGPRGPFKGPRGPFKDPGVFVKGPRGPFKGPPRIRKSSKSAAEHRKASSWAAARPAHPSSLPTLWCCSARFPTWLHFGVPIKFLNFLRAGNWLFWGSGGARGPRRPFKKVGARPLGPAKWPPRPPGPPRTPK